jgi:hypothetical protein
LIGAVVLIASLAGAYAFGRNDGRDLERTKWLEVQQSVEATRVAAREGAAEAISQIEVKHVTIRQQAETVTREVPVYGDCRHDPDGMRLVNEALESPGSNTGPGSVPAPDPAD